VRVDPHLRDNVFHDRLPSMRLWRHLAPTRELVALTTVLSASSTTTLRWRAGHSILSNRETALMLLSSIDRDGRG
jgi:hypothetical protein